MRRYYPYVGPIDPETHPHLAAAAEQVEVMQRCVTEMWDNIWPWTYFRWRRAHQAWKEANEIWDREMALHKADNPHLVS